MLENQLLFAHNAPFDFNVLAKTLEYYRLEFPNLTFGCTLQIARIVFPKRVSSAANDFRPYGLAALCQTHRIKFQHHRASEDARATAELALKMFAKHGIDSVDDIAENLGIRLGGMTQRENGWTSKKGKSKQKAKKPTQQKQKTQRVVSPLLPVGLRPPRSRRVCAVMLAKRSKNSVDHPIKCNIHLVRCVIHSSSDFRLDAIH